MKVLVACERSQVVTKAFLARGHDAWSCDLVPAEGDRPDRHLEFDCRALDRQCWDLVIGHPPCTFLSLSGVRWLGGNVQRHLDMIRGVHFFNWFLDHPCKRVCVENPIMHGYASRLLVRRYDQVVNPWMFGEPEQKQTCLWLKGLGPLFESLNCKIYMDTLPRRERERVHYMSPGADRGAARSVTSQGLADAMALQWGSE